MCRLSCFSMTCSFQGSGLVCSSQSPVMGVTAQRFILQPQHSLKELCHGCSILPLVARLIVCSDMQSSLMRREWMWKWGSSLLAVLVSAGWPGLTWACSEGWGHSHAPVTDQKGLINLACFNYYVGAGALEVSVQLCLQDVDNLQMDRILGSLSRSGAAWSLPSAHQNHPGDFGWLSSLLVWRNNHKAFQSQWCGTSVWCIKGIINDMGRREGCLGKLQRLIWNVIILGLQMMCLFLEGQLGCNV